MRNLFIILSVLIISGLPFSYSAAQTAHEYFTRAGEQYKEGNYKESIDLYSKAISINPDFGPSYNNRAAAEVSLRRYDDALSDYDKAIELMPENAGSYYGRGLTKILMFKEEAGCKDLNEAKELGHTEAESAVEKYCSD